ncbi:MAG: proline iminopeptidase-family hydrolase [Solirubrobacterales bacterium]
MSATEIPSWEGKVTLADGYERFVKRYGEGPQAIVCQNGGPGADLHFYEPLRAMVDEEIQIVLYDQLDSGKSDRSGREELWTPEFFAGEFEALVAELGLGRVHLLGQSWGGMLALECALRTPQLIKSLMLCNTLADTQECARGMRELVAEASAGAQRAVAENREFDPADDSPEGRGLLELYASHLRRGRPPFDLDRSCREFVEEIAPEFGELGPTYYYMWGNSEFAPTGPLLEWSVADRLGEIGIPALVVCGRFDEVRPSCSQTIAEGLADARWLILGQSSHMVFHEVEKDVLMAALRGFVLENAGR